MKLVLRLIEKPRGKNPRFSSLTVSLGGVYLSFSEERIHRFNLFSFDEEKNTVTIDNITITAGFIRGGKDYRYGQSYETLPDEDKKIIRQALQSDKSVLKVLEVDWFELDAELKNWYY